MNLHIYTRPNQPATNWVDHHTGYRVRWKPRVLLYVECCDRLRRAENCVVQAYYDHLGKRCAPGKGCKSAVFLEAKRLREFRNRSRGQRRRFRG